MIYKRGRFRGDKVLYKDGIGCCVWTPIDEHEDTGLCFDFSGEDIDDFINLLLDLREAEAEVYQEK